MDKIFRFVPSLDFYNGIGYCVFQRRDLTAHRSGIFFKRVAVITREINMIIAAARNGAPGNSMIALLPVNL